MSSWVKFNKHYAINKKTCEVKSCERKIKNTHFNRTIKERILKPQNGFIYIDGKSLKVTDIYKKVFGKEFIK